MTASLSHAGRLLAAERELARRGFSLNRGRGTGIYPEWHHHQGLELLWIEQGVGQVYVDDQSYVFGAGDAILLNGNAGHTLRLLSGAFVRVLLYFSTDVLNRPLLKELRTLRAVAERGLVRARPPATVQARLDGWVRAMLEELHQDRPGGDAAIAAYLQLLLVELERHLSERSPHAAGDAVPVEDTGARAVRGVLAYIEAHLGEPTTLEEMGRALAVSPRHLERCFSENVGTSIMAFWFGRRMEQAAALLRRPEASIAEVAAGVGYASAFAFSRAYKRYFGVPPSQARRLDR
jgi:AraC-like DNA-binding protein